MNGEHLEAAQRAIGIHIEAKRSKLMALSEVKVLAFDVFATVDDDRGTIMLEAYEQDTTSSLAGD